jgi:hypothetical protein
MERQGHPLQGSDGQPNYQSLDFRPSTLPAPGRQMFRRLHPSIASSPTSTPPSTPCSQPSARTRPVPYNAAAAATACIQTNSPCAPACEPLSALVPPTLINFSVTRILSSAMWLVNRAVPRTFLRLRVDKPILLVLNVHRERSRNGLALPLGWFLD